MKNFTFLVAGLFCSLAISAQTPTFEKVWNHSVGATEDVSDPFNPKMGDPPVYINQNGETERSMAIYNGKLYIPSRASGNQIHVVDGMTGELDKTITLPETITGGTYAINQIVIDENGMMLITNLVTAATDPTAAAPFKGYLADLNEASPTFRKMFEIPNANNLRYGDGIGLHGYLDEGLATLVVPEGNGSYVMTIKLNNGNYVEHSELITEATFGTAPAVVKVTENDYIIKSHNLNLSRFEMGKPAVIEEMSPLADGTPNLGISSGTMFDFQSASYLLICAVNIDGAPLGAKGDGHEGIFELIKIPADGISGDVEFLSFFPDANKGLQGTTGTRQVSFSAPVCVDVRRDAVYLYMLWPRGGVACYKMTVNGDNIAGNTIDGIPALYPNPATDIVNIAGEPALVEFFTVTGQRVMAVANQNEIKVVGLHGIYLVTVTDVVGNKITTKLSVK